jgi:hypothetical protein
MTKAGATPCANDALWRNASHERRIQGRSWLLKRHFGEAAR